MKRKPLPKPVVTRNFILNQKKVAEIQEKSLKNKGEVYAAYENMKMLETLPFLDIYTDASSDDKRNIAGIAAVAVFYEKDNEKHQITDYGLSYQCNTENTEKLEMNAVFNILKLIKEKGLDKKYRIRLFCDSKIVVDIMTDVVRKDSKVYSYLNQAKNNIRSLHVNVLYSHIKGHADNSFNNRADKIAGRIRTQKTNIFKEIKFEE